jgi:Bacterial capsule synthesis protein PGA_cap
VRGGSLARGVVRTGERSGGCEGAGEIVDIERVDEDAGVARHELRRAADPRGDDGAATRHRLEQRLAERLDEARLREDMAGGEQARDLIVGDPAEELDVRAPFEGGALRPVADERQRPLRQAGEGVGEADDVLSLGERADAEEARRAVGRGLNGEALAIDAARDDRGLPGGFGQLRLELTAQVVGDADDGRGAPDDEASRGRDPGIRADVSDVAAVGGDDERCAAGKRRDQPRGDEEVRVDDIRLARGERPPSERDVAELPSGARVEDGELHFVAARDECPLDLRNERPKVWRVRPGIHLRDDENPHERSVCWTPVGRRGLPGVAIALALLAAAVSTAAAKTPATVTLDWVGDIALNGPAPSSLFTDVGGTLRRADVTMGNLEGTLGSGGTSKCPAHDRDCFAFQSPAASAVLLREAGFDDMNVANNHALDYGTAGQASTLRALAHQHLRWSGRPGQITVVATHGVRIAILGFAPYPWAQSLLDIPAAEQLVRKAKPRADIVVCVLHAGAEGTAYQHVGYKEEYYLGEDRGNARRFAHAVIGAGADLVVASGPHVLRGMELLHGHLIAYSLGNFATAGGALSTTGILGQSGILHVTLATNGQFVSGRFSPVEIVGSGAPELVKSSAIISRVNTLSREDFGKTAVKILASGVLRARP